MSNKKRVVLTVLALALVCALSIAGTLAYLTAKTEEVHNTFAAAGLVGPFTLDESPIQGDGPNAQGEYTLQNVARNARVQANAYNQVVPDTEIPKDPEVYMKDLKFDSYLFLEVVDELPNTITWTIANGWTELTGVTGDNGGKIYYRDALVANNNNDGEEIFKVIANDKLIVSPNYGKPDETQEEVVPAVTNGELNFNAYLVQKADMTAAQAWDAR